MNTMSRFYESTKDLLLVQAFLEHRSLAATLVYASSVGLAKDFMPKLPGADKFQPLVFEAGWPPRKSASLLAENETLCRHAGGS